MQSAAQSPQLNLCSSMMATFSIPCRHDASEWVCAVLDDVLDDVRVTDLYHPETPILEATPQTAADMHKLASFVHACWLLRSGSSASAGFLEESDVELESDELLEVPFV